VGAPGQAGGSVEALELISGPAGARAIPGGATPRELVDRLLDAVRAGDARSRVWARLPVQARDAKLRCVHDPADLRAFAHRPWREMAAAKVAFWKAEKARLGPGEIWAMGDALRAEARALRPDWPSEREREEDLAVHTRVARSLALARARTDD